MTVWEPGCHRNRGCCTLLKVLQASPLGVHEKSWEQASRSENAPLSGADIGEGAAITVRKAPSPTKTFLLRGRKEL